jgi:hypothetical protein
MRSSIFWDITLYSPLRANRRFGGTCHLNLQGPRKCQARNQHESMWQANSACSLHSSWLLEFQRTTRHIIPEDGPLRHFIVWDANSAVNWTTKKLTKKFAVKWLTLFVFWIPGFTSRLGNQLHWQDFRVVTCSGFAWLIKRVSDLMVEFIGPLYNLLQHFANLYLRLDTLDFSPHYTNPHLLKPESLTVK